MTDSNIQASVKAQVEYYFSPSNLSRDAYLRNQLMPGASGPCIATSIIANFPKVKSLTLDHKLIIRSLEGSEVVTASNDGKWLTPSYLPPPASPSSLPPSPSHGLPPTPSSDSTSNATSNIAATDSTPSPSTRTRNTVILRDVPPSTTSTVVLSTFTTATVTPKSARPDVGNTWYVVFENEKDAVDAVFECRSKTIEGQPVRARVKSEATAPTQSYSAPYSAPGVQIPGPGGVPRGVPGGPMMNPFQPAMIMGNPYAPQQMNMGYSPSNAAAAMYMQGGSPRMYQGFGGNQGFDGRGRGRGMRGGRGGGRGYNNQQGKNNKGGSNSGGGGNNQGEGNNSDSNSNNNRRNSGGGQQGYNNQQGFNPNNLQIHTMNMGQGGGASGVGGAGGQGGHQGGLQGGQGQQGGGGQYQGGNGGQIHGGQGQGGRGNNGGQGYNNQGGGRMGGEGGGGGGGGHGKDGEGGGGGKKKKPKNSKGKK
ncbi:hypothetical protein TrCOL_g5174, partial [Triparma columacea]